jgi:hypothetical protein
MPNSDNRFDTANLLVEIKLRLSDGAIWTSHRPATAGDAGRLEQWPSGGLVQTAHALLIEALRREAYTMAIAIMSKQDGYLDEQTLKEALRMQVISFLEDFCTGAVQDAMSKINQK